MEFGKEYIKTFDTEEQYLAFKASSGYNEPNVSYISGDSTVHYNPIFIETRVVATFNVTDTSNPTQIISTHALGSPFSAIEIDGVEQPSVVSTYTFSTTGEHTVKYTLTDPISIGYYAFHHCSNLTSIIIPDSVTSIGMDTFEECTSLITCTIGSGVTSIGDYSFDYCTGLTSIDIPSGVTSIGGYAFSNCRKLTSVTVNAATPPTLGSDVFYNNASGRKIYVPSASVNAYENKWLLYASDIEPIS